MKKIAKNLTELIGNTPLLELSRFTKAVGLSDVKLLAKLEFFNPLGSVKDRAALAMIEDAEQKGLISQGSVIIEPTSGNTGIGLAYVCAIKGYQLVLAMPESMSLERRSLLTALGAKLELTPAPMGMKGAISRANELLAETAGAYMPMQFENPANPNIHEKTTAEEIWRDTEGEIDAFVAGVGTGGTISGVSRGLKSHRGTIKCFAVEPEASPVLSGGSPSPHKIQGIGAGFVPKNYDAEQVDGVITVSNEDAFSTARQLSKTEGLIVGISSGAAIMGAVKICRQDSSLKTVVIVLPDTGERYLSSGLYSEQ